MSDELHPSTSGQSSLRELATAVIRAMDGDIDQTGLIDLAKSCNHRIWALADSNSEESQELQQLATECALRAIELEPQQIGTAAEQLKLLGRAIKQYCRALIHGRDFAGAEETIAATAQRLRESSVFAGDLGLPCREQLVIVGIELIRAELLALDPSRAEAWQQQLSSWIQLDGRPSWLGEDLRPHGSRSQEGAELLRRRFGIVKTIIDLHNLTKDQDKQLKTFRLVVDLLGAQEFMTVCMITGANLRAQQKFAQADFFLSSALEYFRAAPYDGGRQKASEIAHSLGMLRREEGKPGEANEWLRRACEWNPHDTVALNGMVDLLLVHGSPSHEAEARWWSEDRELWSSFDGTRGRQSNFANRLLWATYFRKKGQLKKALEEIYGCNQIYMCLTEEEKTSLLKPVQVGRMYREWASLLHAQGHPNEAYQQVLTALSLDTDEETYFFSLRLAADLALTPEQITNYWRTAIGRAEGHRLTVLLCQFAKDVIRGTVNADLAEAIKALEFARDYALETANRVSARQTNIVLNQLGAALARYVPQRRDEGLAILRGAFESVRQLKVEGQAYASTSALTTELTRAGKYAEARTVLEEQLGYNASLRQDSHFLLKLAETCARDGDPETAQVYAGMALEEVRGSKPLTEARLLAHAGRVYQLARNRARARECLQDAQAVLNGAIKGGDEPREELLRQLSYTLWGLAGICHELGDGRAWADHRSEAEQIDSELDHAIGATGASQHRRHRPNQVLTHPRLAIDHLLDDEEWVQDWPIVLKRVAWEHLKVASSFKAERNGLARSEFDKALRLIKKALDLSPADPEFVLAQARIMRASGANRREWLLEATRAQDLIAYQRDLPGQSTRELAEIYGMQGECYELLDSPDEALNSYQFAISLLASDISRKTILQTSYFYTKLGYISEYTHRYADAEQFYRKAVSTQPVHYDAYRRFARLLLEHGLLNRKRALLGKCPAGMAETEWIQRQVGRLAQEVLPNITQLLRGTQGRTSGPDLQLAMDCCLELFKVRTDTWPASVVQLVYGLANCILGEILPLLPGDKLRQEGGFGPEAVATLKVVGRFPRLFPRGVPQEWRSKFPEWCRGVEKLQACPPSDRKVKALGAWWKLLRDNDEHSLAVPACEACLDSHREWLGTALPRLNFSEQLPATCEGIAYLISRKQYRAAFSHWAALSEILYVRDPNVLTLAVDPIAQTIRQTVPSTATSSQAAAAAIHQVLSETLPAEFQQLYAQRFEAFNPDCLAAVQQMVLLPFIYESNDTVYAGWLTHYLGEYSFASWLKSGSDAPVQAIAKLRGDLANIAQACHAPSFIGGATASDGLLGGPLALALRRASTALLSELPCQQLGNPDRSSWPPLLIITRGSIIDFPLGMLSASQWPGQVAPADGRLPYLSELTALSESPMLRRYGEPTSGQDHAEKLAIASLVNPIQATLPALKWVEELLDPQRWNDRDLSVKQYPRAEAHFEQLFSPECLAAEILHLGCHGEAPSSSEDPWDATLHLPRSPENSNPVKVRDLIWLNGSRPKWKLLMLTSCDIGQAQHLSHSLLRSGLLHAVVSLGCRYILAHRWAIHKRAAQLFVPLFIEEWHQMRQQDLEPCGAQILQRAQRRYLQEAVHIHKDLCHPSYWAGWTILDALWY